MRENRAIKQKKPENDPDTIRSMSKGVHMQYKTAMTTYRS